MSIKYRISSFKLQHITKSTKQIVRIYIFIFFLVSSCSNPYKNLTKTEYPEKNTSVIPYSLPYTDRTIIYKADLSFYKNTFGGLLIIKKTEINKYRIVLTTQFGLKIFDFELNQGKLNVVFCIDQLNKKMIINTFEEDFNILLMQEGFEQLFEMQNPEQNQKIWQLKSGKFSTYFIQNNESVSIDNISKRKRNSEKISVGLYDYKKEIPGEIVLQHSNIKFKMNLKLIQQ